MFLAQHPTTDLPVLNKPLCASGVFTEKMFRVILVAGMRDSTWALNGLAAKCRSAQRVVGLVVVVCAERFTVKDVERFVGEWFLLMISFGISQLAPYMRPPKGTYLASVACEALPVIFAF